MTKNYVGTAIFDIDGVLCDVESEFCERFGYDNRHLYNFEKRYPKVDPEIITEFLNDPMTYLQASAIFGGTLLLNQARERGWKIILMTARPNHLEKPTMYWLDQFCVQYDKLYFSRYKGDSIKDMDLQDGKPMFLVDDSTNQLDNLPRGVTEVAWEQPWNEFTPHIKARYNDEKMIVERLPRYQAKWTPFWE